RRRRMDTVAPTSAGGRAARRAMSIGGDEGWRRDRMPNGKRAVGVKGIVQSGSRPASALQRQETIGQETQRCMMVEAWPGASFEMVQPQFFFELLIALLHLPARLPHTHRVLPRGRCGQIGQRVAAPNI